jgi:hypothetical protein
MTDHDLEQVVFLAIARNPPHKQPAAVLAAIREAGFVVIEREWWLAIPARERAVAHRVSSSVKALQLGDLDEG